MANLRVALTFKAPKLAQNGLSDAILANVKEYSLKAIRDYYFDRLSNLGPVNEERLRELQTVEFDITSYPKQGIIIILITRN